MNWKHGHVVAAVLSCAQLWLFKVQLNLNVLYQKQQKVREEVAGVKLGLNNLGLLQQTHHQEMKGKVENIAANFERVESAFSQVRMRRRRRRRLFSLRGWNQPSHR